MSNAAVIMDVDGVLVDSPHERAWRETLERLMDGEWADVRASTAYAPELFTPAVYNDVVAGKPRLDGARDALSFFGVPDAERRAQRYAELKQARVAELIEVGQFAPFPDALRFVRGLRGRGMRLAVASSSKNAGLLLDRVRVGARTTLRECFDADVSARELRHGKPDPEIFLLAARALGEQPSRCVVVEDAVAGIAAAKHGGMAALGVARDGDEDRLVREGADLVVRTLDDIDLDELHTGRLARRARLPEEKTTRLST